MKTISTVLLFLVGCGARSQQPFEQQQTARGTATAPDGWRRQAEDQPEAVATAPDGWRGDEQPEAVASAPDGWRGPEVPPELAVEEPAVAEAPEAPPEEAPAVEEAPAPTQAEGDALSPEDAQAEAEMEARRAYVDALLAQLRVDIEAVRGSQDLEHRDVGLAFQHLADAITGLSDAPDVTLSVDRMRAMSAQITESDWRSLMHADWAKDALDHGAAALTSIVEDGPREAFAARLGELRVQIDQMDDDTPLLQQTDVLADALWQMGGIVNDLNARPERVGQRG